GGRLDVRREDQVGLLAGDGGDDLVDRWRREGRLPSLLHGTRLEHDGFGGDAPHLEYLGPAIAEPAGPDHEALATVGELARHALHAEAAAARHHDRGRRVVHVLEGGRDVQHHLLELPRHVVQRAVGEHHRVLEQAVWIDVGQQAGHGGSPWFVWVAGPA